MVKFQNFIPPRGSGSYQWATGISKSIKTTVVERLLDFEEPFSAVTSVPKVDGASSMKLFFPKRLQGSIRAFIHGNVLQKTRNAQHIINLRRRVAQFQMRHFELILSRREDLIDLLQGSHARARKCIKIVHIYQKITCATVVSRARGFE